MNRINLRLFQPADSAPESVPMTQVPDVFEDIIPIERARRSVILSGRFMPAVDRAKLIHRNSECPECHKHDIEPLELDDAMVSSRSRLPIPGTATIIGFHCNDCGTEWPVYELTRRSV
ncbi:MAG: hypothetical protein JNM43_16465 [Planctomycetaceae bacterium]|nr:hypothetical protein [Planctomycetaceae bacterium]